MGFRNKKFRFNFSSTRREVFDGFATLADDDGHSGIRNDKFDCVLGFIKLVILERVADAIDHRREERVHAALLTGGAALALRIATGVFTLGWTPSLCFGADG